MLGRNMALAAAAWTLAGALAAPALAAPPALQVSSNGRFLQQEDGAPFVWIGDTGWLMLKRLDRAETERYLEDRRAKGFNVIQAMVLHTADDADAYGDKALIDADPARPLTTPGADPDRAGEYDYWDHVDWVVDLASRKGMYLALVPAWGSLAGGGQLTPASAEAYARFLARRYGARTNIIWLNGGDTRGDRNTETWQALGRTLKAGAPDQLMTFHPFGRMQSSTWFHDAPWLDFNMFQSGHQTYAQDRHGKGEDNWRHVQEDLARTPAKPTIDGEPSYEDIPHGLHTDGPRWQAADARRYAYWSVFAGAFGHTYGDNAVMQMYAPGRHKPAYHANRSWSVALDDPGAGQMRHLKALLLSRPVLDRVPDQGAIAGDNGERYERVLATRGRDYLFAYSYTGRPFALKLGAIGGRQVRAWWFDPRTGKAAAAGRFANRGVKRFVPPGAPSPGNDWVLVLDNAAKGFAAPGAVS